MSIEHLPVHWSLFEITRIILPSIDIDLSLTIKDVGLVVTKIEDKQQPGTGTVKTKILLSKPKSCCQNQNPVVKTKMGNN